MSWDYVLPRRIPGLVIPPQTNKTDSEKGRKKRTGFSCIGKINAGFLRMAVDRQRGTLGN